MEPDTAIHYFASKRQATLVLAMLARTADTGGKRCFDIVTQPDCAEVKNPRTLYKLVFLPAKWNEIMNAKDLPDWRRREPPTVKEMAWFVRGYLRALTGVKPTVL